MALKRQIERIERTIEKMDRPKTNEDLRRDVIETLGLPQDISEEHLIALIFLHFGGSNPDYLEGNTDEEFVRTVRDYHSKAKWT